MSFRVPDRTGSKRSRSRSPSSWRRSEKFPRQMDGDSTPKDRSRTPRHNGASGRYPRNMKEQTQLNQLQEDEKMREWVAQEDDFVLKQAKKKAEIRVKEGRAKPIDWLTITLRVIDPTRDPLDDEIADSELDLIDLDGVFEGLSPDQLRDLEADIDTFLTLEKHPKNRDFWKVYYHIWTLLLKQDNDPLIDNENSLWRSQTKVTGIRPGRSSHEFCR